MVFSGAAVFWLLIQGTKKKRIAQAEACGYIYWYFNNFCSSLPGKKCQGMPFYHSIFKGLGVGAKGLAP